MRATNKDNNSALKRLVPAVAMLALSAVTLSTSTYAWFTMNKSVEMTGLNMSATVGEGMEISLASITGNDAINLKNDSSGAYYDNGHPFDVKNGADVEEKGWSSAVVVSEYYAQIGKLKPASSINAKALYDATNASAGGTKASTFKDVSSTAASITKRASKESGAIAQDGTEGYYLDIPVHLRTSKVDSGNKGDIFCKIIIKDGSATKTEELYKAVRVAFFENDSEPTYIFACDKNYYKTDERGNGQAVTTDNVKATVTKLKTDGVRDGTNDSAPAEGASIFDGITAVDSGLKINYADTAGKYGHLDFTARVWLEGESTSCYNSNAGQTWNIDFAFYLGDPAAQQAPGGN